LLRSTLHSDTIGTCFAVSMFTLHKLSSRDLPDGEFPVVCLHCGYHGAIPTADGTSVGEHALHLAMQCVVCGERWLARALNVRIHLRPKMDRRKWPRLRSERMFR
jgi:hypothetical protein